MKNIKVQNIGVRSIKLGDKHISPGETITTVNHPDVDYWLSRGKIKVYNAILNEGD